MLVLSRKAGESICLFDPEGKQIAKIEVIEVRRSVRLGIVAAPEVRILREELIADKDTGAG